MTETARIYGGSLYDLAAEENLTSEILGQMEQIRDRKSTRLNSSHRSQSRMPSSA